MCRPRRESFTFFKPLHHSPVPHGFNTMNSSEGDSKWFGAPDLYAIEISESQRLSDVNGTDATRNGTLNYPSKWLALKLIVTSIQRLFHKQHTKSSCGRKKLSSWFSCSYCGCARLDCLFIAGGKSEAASRTRRNSKRNSTAAPVTINQIS